MGLVSLQAGPIYRTVKQNVSQINEKITNSMFTLITLLCNTTFASVNTSVRPRVKVSQKNIDESFLYDTGAQRTCMPFKAFKRIYGPDSLKHKKQIHENLNIKDAGGNDLGYKGTFMVEMEIFGRQVEHDLVVLEHVQDYILGSDFIHKHLLAYNPSSRDFEWKLPPTNTGTLKAAEHMKISALSSKIIKLKCYDSKQVRMGHNEEMVCLIDTGHTLLTGPPGMIKFDREGNAFTVIQNCGPFSMEISRNDVIGTGEIIETNCKKEKLDANFISALRQNTEINSTSETYTREESDKWTDERKRKHIIEHANITVPEEYREQYITLLVKHFSVISVNKHDLGRVKTFFHKIHLKDNDPVYRKQFKIPDAHRPFLEESLEEWLKLGVVQKSDSLYNSPVFCVPKKGGHGYRIVQDFRELNQKSYTDKYTMKDIHECIGDIGKAESTIFSTIDLTSGFWQMPLHPESVPKTAFTLPGLGQFEWLMSPMGLIGCPASFQRLMEKVMEGIDNVLVYIDDLLLHSKTHPEHLQTLDQTLTRLEEHNLKINIAKCFFGCNEVAYLGFRLTPEGIIPGKDKLKAVENAKIPTSKAEIKSFVGLCNFFRTHIKDFSRICDPLNKATRKDSPYVKGEITGEALKAFHILRNLLITEPIMAYPRKDRTYAVFVDAATGTPDIDGGMGAILAQIDSAGKFHSIAYASKQLLKHQKNYSPYLLELDATVWAMEYWQEYLRGRKFVLYSDHRPLESLGTLHTKTMNRLALAMMDFDFEIRYCKGEEMPADFLSRSNNEIMAISMLDLNWEEAQNMDNLTNLIKESLEDKWQADRFSPPWYKKAENLAHNAVVDNNLLWINHKGKKLLYVPNAIRSQLLYSAHGDLLMGHHGVQKTKEKLQECYFWLNMDEDIKHHIASCLKCQANKADKFPRKAELQSMPQCSTPNQRIHLDLFGPCKTSDMGNKYILTMTDAFTKYAEVVAIPNKEATTVATELFNKWICRYGCPAIIHTDQGKEFINKITEELYKKLDIKRTNTAPYHPQCNSQAEIFNVTLAKFLRNVVDESTLDWELYLAPLMFSYNTSYHSTTKSSPFELLYGMKPRLPAFPGPELDRINYGEHFVAERLQILKKARQIAMDNSLEAGLKHKMAHDAKSKPHNIVEGDMVFVENQLFLGKNKKFSAKWTGPFAVTKVINEQNVEVQISPRRKAVHSVYRLKKFIDPENSKYLDEEKLQKHILPSDPNEEFSKLEKMQEKEEMLRNKAIQKDLIKNSIEKRVTRSMSKNETSNSKLNQQQSAIFAIGNLIISDSEKLTLWMIVWKIHQYLPLSQEEHIYWNSFEPKERNFLLTGDEVFSPEIPQIPNNLLKLTKNIEKVIHFQPNQPLNPLPAEHPPIDLPEEILAPDNVDWEETAEDLDFEEPPPPPPPTEKKKAGRPKGSKNKPKPPIDPEAIANQTRKNPRKDYNEDDGSCLQSSLFCDVSPHPVKWKPNSISIPN